MSDSALHVGPIELDEALCRGIVENCADAVLIVSPDQRIAYANKSAEKMFGYLKGSFVGKPLSALVPREFREKHRGLVESFRDSSQRARFMEDRGTQIYGVRANGTVFPVSVSILKSSDDHSTALVAIIRDKTKQRAMEVELEILANTDPLTGILNRRAFLSRAEEERARAQRYGRPMSLAMIDIDHFKAVNDSYGHAAGDQALRHVAGIISSALRQSDLFGRLGGEEFALLLPETDEPATVVMAQRLRRGVARSEIEIGAPHSKPVRVSVSIGVAGLHGQEETLDELLQKADQALYCAKRTGRNKVSAVGDAEQELLVEA